MALYVVGTDKIYESRIDNLVQATRGNTVASGCQVVAHAVPDMGVRVGVGVIFANGLRVAVAQTDLTVTANGTGNNRIDLVSVNMTTGVPTITAGTAAATPKPPSVAATDILLGFVSVPAGAANIQNSNITDCRLLQSWRLVSGSLANRPAAGSFGGAGATYYATDADQPELYRDNSVTWDSLTSRYQNLILNSDFGRRNIWGFAMPEVFADTNGYTQLDGGAAPTVTTNILTFGAANNILVWPKVGYPTCWREGRASATFKAISTSGGYQLRIRYTDDSNYVRAFMDGAGNFVLGKVIAGTPTTLATVAQALTLNNWYWLEIEGQGTTFIAKLYNTASTGNGILKSASSLLQTLVGTAADAILTVGGLSIQSNQAASQWGGIVGSPGGIYFETWMPENFPVTFTGTLGGQAVSFDESVDVGPPLGGKQWALRFYIPHISRAMYLGNQNTKYTGTFSPFIAPTTTYMASCYVKTGGFAGSGALVRPAWRLFNSADVQQTNITLSDAAETAWTRKTAAVASVGSSYLTMSIDINVAGTASGTGYIQLVQFEMGSTATAWRNAPEDGAAGLVLQVLRAASADITTTSASFVEPDSRDLAANFFAPWDCTLSIQVDAQIIHGTAGQNVDFTVTVDGVAINPLWRATAYVANYAIPVKFAVLSRVGVGKHRIAIQWRTSAATATIQAASFNTYLNITAYRGK